MTPTDIDQSIIAQEVLRHENTTAQMLAQDNESFKYVTVISYDNTLRLWNVQAGAAKIKAIYQGNAAIAIGDTVHYYKANGQNYGYIRTMPRA